MKRALSGRNIVLLLAILFVVAVMLNRKPPEPEDPLRDSQQKILEAFGLQVEPVPSGNGGLIVQKVLPDTRGQQIGIEAGDRLLAVNERSIWHVKNMEDLLQTALERGPVFLLLERKGTYRQVLLAGGYSSQGGQPGGGGRGGARGRGG
jgi:type II secretory pathway component PulC